MLAYKLKATSKNVIPAKAGIQKRVIILDSRRSLPRTWIRGGSDKFGIIRGSLNGKNLSPDHGFPLRLIIPRMYAYKGVKWVERIVFTEKQEVGYWEKGGYPVDGSIPGLGS